MVKIIDSLLEEYKNYNDPYKINGSNEPFFYAFSSLHLFSTKKYK